MKFVLPIYLLLFFGCSPKKEQHTVVTADVLVPHSIDHVILAINNLDSGIAQFERKTGVTPVYGGQHPGRGSHNALVSFGEHTYLEILAPRMDLDSAEAQLVAYLEAYETLTMIGWAVTSEDTTATKKKLEELGFAVGGFTTGGREKPNGDKLAWTTFQVEEKEMPSLPFFIHWHEGTAHPATTSPGGSSLSNVLIRTPNHKKMNTLTKGLDLPVKASPGDSLTLQLVLEVEGSTLTL